MNPRTFTRERSYLALLQLLLPPRADTSGDDGGGPAVQPASLPGQNALEVHGMAVLVSVFYVVWCGDLLNSFWLAVPAGLVWLHLLALAGAVTGDGLARLSGDTAIQGYVGPQIAHWSFLILMAAFAVGQPLPVARWLAWPLLVFLAANAFAWFALRKWWAAGLALVWHLAALVVWAALGWEAGLLMLVAVHAVMLHDALSPHGRLFTPLVRRFAARGDEIWLTIDDGPGEDTDAILDLLDQHGARATFFLVGSRVEARPADAEAILARGHDIGNHSHRHLVRSFWMLSGRAMESEISRAQETLRGVTGRVPVLFRSPVGFTNPWLRPVLERHGLTLVGWTARGFDGVDSRPDRVLARLKRQIRPGAIVLLHQGRPVNEIVLRELLPWLDSQGIRCVVPNLFENETARLS